MATSSWIQPAFRVSDRGSAEDPEDWWADFAHWPLRDRLQLAAFEAELVGCLCRSSARWQAIACLPGPSASHAG